MTPTEPDQFQTLSVRTRLTNGNLTAATAHHPGIRLGEPTLDVPAGVSAGKPAEFTFHAVLPGSASFGYSWDEGAIVTVPAGPDGVGKATIVPAESGWHTLSVFSTLTPLHAYSQTLLVTGTFGDGTQSETRRYGFYANQITTQPQPSLASTEPQKTPLS